MSSTKKELFITLAKPDSEGVSRWVKKEEFVGEYEALKLGNGGSWCRKTSSLAKQYNLEFDKSLTSGNSIDAIRTMGYKKSETFNQAIRSDIKEFYKNKKCVMLGIIGNSENTKIEIDHKDGRKNNKRVSNLSTQTKDDFQPLTKAANDAKRQICKKCIDTNIRWDAKNIEGNPISYYKGGSSLEEYGCEGCYQYDPVQYRKEVIKQAKDGKF